MQHMGDQTIHIVEVEYMHHESSFMECIHNDPLTIFLVQTGIMMVVDSLMSKWLCCSINVRTFIF